MGRVLSRGRDYMGNGDTSVEFVSIARSLRIF